MRQNEGKQTCSAPPKSGKKKVPCEVYSRVVGYLRPVQNWNKGKKQEFKERATYSAKGRHGRRR